MDYRIVSVKDKWFAESMEERLEDEAASIRLDK